MKIKSIIITSVLIVLIASSMLQVLLVPADAIVWFVLPAIFAGIGGTYGGFKASGGTCNVFTAPVGGNQELCETCQQNPLIPCTEYRCKSIAQSCEYFQQERKCTYVDKRDLTPPKIIKCEARDSSQQKNYNINSPSSQAGCEFSEPIPEFESTIIRFEINEFSQCRFSPVFGKEFDPADKDSTWLGNALFSEEHFLGVEIANVSEQLLEENCKGGEACEFYIRCRDKQGNAMKQDYFLKFKVKEGPDLQPPVIEQTSVPSGVSISSSRTEANFSMFVSDRTGIKQCRYSRDRDKPFDEMTGPKDGNFTCGTQLNLEERGFECSTTFKELDSQQDNKFYFRCQDTSTDKNTNEQGFEFIIKPSQPLDISNKKLPSDVILTRETTLELTTNNPATCYYSLDKAKELIFNQTESLQHSTIISPSNGPHELKVRCIDEAGNEKTEPTTFLSDSTRAPILKKIYTDSGLLLVRVNNPASCAYSTTDVNFDFEDGTEMTETGELTYKTSSSDKNAAVFYVKCKHEITGYPSKTYTIFP